MTNTKLIETVKQLKENELELACYWSVLYNRAQAEEHPEEQALATLEANVLFYLLRVNKLNKILKRLESSIQTHERNGRTELTIYSQNPD